MAVCTLSGCSGQNDAQESNDGRISISMYMWDRSMFKELSPWLEQKFPDIDFTFVQGYNTMEYYKAHCYGGSHKDYHNEPEPVVFVSVINAPVFATNNQAPSFRRGLLLFS